MSLCCDGLSNDQCFLVNFIMSNYLGPDLYYDNPRCSASQRLAKGLPPYTLNHIGSSSLNVAQLQNLYYYVLRNADSSLLLRPDMIYAYLKGCIPLEPSQNSHQFTYFFPTSLHPHKSYSPSQEIVEGYSPSLEIVKGIVVIDDPAVEFINKEELQRFRCLSLLNDLKIDRAVSLSPRPVQLDGSRRTEQDCSRNGEVTTNGLVTNQDVNSYGELGETCKRKKQEEAVADHDVCVISETREGVSGSIPQSQGKEQGCSRNWEATSNGLVSDQDLPKESCKRKKKEEEAVADHAFCGISKTPDRFRETYKRKRFKNSSTKARNKNGETLTERDRTYKPTSLPLVIVPPEIKEGDAEPAVVTTGTASKENFGPSIGTVDIGVNKVAYCFQVALPGVYKDYGEFSCEIESDGKVTLEGSSTTGVKTIKKYSRVFEMNNRNLYPPGPFKLCFSLPGPVDPRLVSPVFRTDGIFEAVVIRLKNSN
ncbi:unnamed protein product [Thlaspi arvense]|uniref:SHSP domain-containing protein n=1 Tax=Thlaspi arvense TaxID=13288 RepID=A0AAU9RA02_THLAR|nr:unnamed protein product [Thlaspi arvense]